MTRTRGCAASGPRLPPPNDSSSRADVAAIQQALKSLSPKLRAAIVLKEIEGLTYEQIADVQEISLGTVKSRISRAREELQRALGGAREQNGERTV